MKVTADTMNHFYQNLGKLFFAIAAADQKVTPEEVSVVKNHVTAHWLDLEDSMDYFGSDAAHQIEIVFDYLVDEMPDAETCYRDFADFRKKHDSVFKPEVKDLVWKTSEAIASSFNGKNKSELVMLSRLAQLLGK
jgi:hypothetical protein